MYNKEEPAVVCFDGGNNNIKVIIFYFDKNGFQKAVYSIPHGYVQMTDTEWNRSIAKKQNGRSRSSETFEFQMKIEGELKAFKVGAGAYNSVYNNPLYGPLKYTPGGIDALLSGALLKTFPDGHNNLTLGFGVPPSEWHNIEHIGQLLVKQHRIKIPNKSGKKEVKNISFVVKTGFAWDENAGGLVNLLSLERIRNSKGQYVDSLKEGDRIIVADLGGWLGSIAYATIEENNFAVIDHNNPILAIEGGAIEIRQTLRTTLKDEFVDLRSIRDMDMDDRYLDTVLRTGKIVINGVEKNAEGSIKSAVEGYFGRIKNIYLSRFGGGRLNVKAVALTGGTVDILHRFMPDIFENNRIIYAAERGEIYLANVNGGMIITIENLIENHKLPFDKAIFKEKSYG